MELSPEERRKIYEEEKARIEEEEVKREKQEDKGESSTSLEPKAAALLCYLGIWITGIIFLIIEQKNRFVRYHAIQSILVFGTYTVVMAIFGWIPIFGWILAIILGIAAFIAWIVLMVKAYQGIKYKIPIAATAHIAN